MAYTRHGHQIPNTITEGKKPVFSARCGGVEGCAECKRDAEMHLFVNEGEITDYPAKARKAVRTIVEKNLDYTFGKLEKPAYEIYVVWFCKTLQNWKALLGTTLPNGTYYEVTYDGDKKVTYVDVYVKTENHEIPN